MPVSALPPRSSRGHVTSYGQGRTCAADECETTLSRYNDATLCWRHSTEAEAKRRAVRPS